MPSGMEIQAGPRPATQEYTHASQNACVMNGWREISTPMLLRAGGALVAMWLCAGILFRPLLEVWQEIHAKTMIKVCTRA